MHILTCMHTHLHAPPHPHTHAGNTNDHSWDEESGIIFDDGTTLHDLRVQANVCPSPLTSNLQFLYDGHNKHVFRCIEHVCQTQYFRDAGFKRMRTPLVGYTIPYSSHGVSSLTATDLTPHDRFVKEILGVDSGGNTYVVNLNDEYWQTADGGFSYVQQINATYWQSVQESGRCEGVDGWMDD